MPNREDPGCLRIAELWEKQIDKNIDETRPWGHTLKVEDLLYTLQKVKTLMYNREITAGYNRDPAKDDKRQQQFGIF